MSDLDVVAAAGSLRDASDAAVHLPHRWTPGGVSVVTAFTGGHLLHLAVAGCVLNDVYREAERLGVDVDGVRVTASGGFDTDTWASTGIRYAVEVATAAPADQVEAVLAAVDAAAEIPKAVRAGASVERVRA